MTEGWHGGEAPTVLGSARVLIVDDDAEAVRVLTETLQRGDVRLEVVARSSMHGALDYLQDRPVDGVLLDYDLPDGDGLECLRRIRARDRNLPVLMVTGAGCEEVAAAAMRCGANDYVVKHGNYLKRVSEWVRDVIPRGVPAALDQANARLAGGIFVGREREMETLRAAAIDAMDGIGRLVLVAGEPGIGKTTLAEQGAAYARRRGMRVLRGACHESGGAPAYWPWIQVIRDYAERASVDSLRAEMGLGAARIAQVVAEIGHRLPDLSPTGSIDAEQDRFLFFDNVTTFLRNIARHQPLLLVLDDLHWADKSSLALLQFIARGMADTPLLVIGCYRNVEAGRDDVIADLKGRLSGPVTYMALRGLAEEAVRAQLAAIGGQNVPGGFVRAIFQRTEGNPFFVAETVRVLAEEEVLYHDGARWTSRVLPDEMPIPDRVREAVARRLTHVSDACRRTLSAAAVIGREFGLTEIERLGIGGEHSAAVLREAAAAHVIDGLPGPADRYRFAHALIRETLYEDLPAGERRDLHRRVGELFEQIYGSDGTEHLAELAHHFCQAGAGADAEKATAYAERAAGRAAAQMAHEEAARHYGAALNMLSLVEAPADGRRLELLLQLSDAYWRAGEFEQAKAAARQAVETARRGASGEALARAALAFAGRLTGFGAVVCDEQVVALLEEALVRLGVGESAWHARVMARLAEEISFADERERRRLLGRQAIQMARRGGDPTVLAAVLQSMHWALWSPEKVDQRLDLAREVVRLAEITGDRAMALEGHLFRCFAQLELGDLPAVQAAFDTCVRLAAELRQPYSQWVIESTRVCLAFVEGRLDDVEPLAQRTLQLGQEAANPNAPLFYGVQTGHLYWLRGRFAEMEELLLGFGRTYPLLLPASECGYAVTCAEQGRLDETRAIFERWAADGFAQLPRNVMWAMNMGNLAQACAFLGDRERAAELYALLGPFAGRTIMLAPVLPWGAASYYLGLLAATMGQIPTAACHFREALVTNGRMGMKQWLARTQLAYAELLLAHDLPDDEAPASDLVAAARRTAQQLGMPAVVDRAERLAARYGLDAVVEATPDPAPAIAAAPHRIEAICRREGETWLIGFDQVTFRLRDRVGLRYLVHLLRQPGEDVYCMDLWCTVRGANGPPPVGGLREPLWDLQTKMAVRAQRAELRAELEEAERNNDIGKCERLRQTIGELEAHLLRAVGKGGKDRYMSREVEKVRSRISHGVNDLVNKTIIEHHPALSRYLHDTVHTGFYCVYQPDPARPVIWSF